VVALDLKAECPTCTICHHRDRESIERSLLNSESYRHIATRFDTSTGALQRHRSDHLPVSLTKAHEVRQIARADALIDEVRSGGNRAKAKIVNSLSDNNNNNLIKGS
jgi:hypothetical protein